MGRKPKNCCVLQLRISLEHHCKPQFGMPRTRFHVAAQLAQSLPKDCQLKAKPPSEACTTTPHTSHPCCSQALASCVMRLLHVYLCMCLHSSQTVTCMLAPADCIPLICAHLLACICAHLMLFAHCHLCAPVGLRLHAPVAIHAKPFVQTCCYLPMPFQRAHLCTPTGLHTTVSQGACFR